MHKTHSKSQRERIPYHPGKSVVVKRKRRPINPEWALFAPLLNRAEKETVKHLSQHDAVVFLRARRLDITVAEYKAKYCK